MMKRMRKISLKSSIHAAPQLRLDAKRLALEIRKFESEKPRRDAELQKLEEEVRELRKRWFRKAAYLGPLSAIVVALLGGVLAFGTDVFKSNLVKLYNKQSELEKTKHDLEATNQRLLSYQGQLESKSSALSAANKTALAQNNALKTRTQSLNLQNSRLTRDVRLAEIRTQVHNLEAEGIRSTSAQPFQEILRLTKRRGTAEVVGTLDTAFHETRLKNVKAALSYALFYATEDERYKSTLQSVCLEYVKAEWTRYPSFEGVCPQLLDDPLFSIDEKASVLKDLYQSYKALPSTMVSHDEEQRQAFLYKLSHWNTAATVKFRDPWFELLARSVAQARTSLDLDYSKPVSGLIKDRNSYVPWQAFEILVLKTVVGPPPTPFSEGYSLGPPLIFVDERGDEGPALIGHEHGRFCPDAPGSFPVCRDAYEKRRKDQVQFLEIALHHASLSSYREWVDGNQLLVSAWLDPSFQTLRACNDQAMEKLVRGFWINLSDLRTQ